MATVDLKALREEMGLTQSQLAAALGVHAPNVTRVENGRASGESYGPRVALLRIERMLAGSDKDAAQRIRKIALDALGRTE